MPTPPQPTPPTPREYRFGPFIFVPQWSAVPGTDRWAHRKGEPRMLTLAWTVFLLIASAVTLFVSNGAGLVRAVQYQANARRLFLIIAIGACVLWPMVRLSQSPPDPRDRRIGRALCLDLFAVSFPIAAVLLPLPILTGWSWTLMLSIWLVICAWSLLTIGTAYWGVASGPDSSMRRATAMAAVLLLTLIVFVGHAWLAAWGVPVHTHRDGWWWAASPLDHLLRLTTPPSGLSAGPTPADWRAIVAVWLAAPSLAVWVSGRARR